MSDEPATDLGYDANIGVTLPDGKNASYNSKLSPLFANNNGRNNPSGGGAMIYRGSSSYYWTGTASPRNGSYLLQLDLDQILPLHNWSNNRLYTLSLRCLVSTNNR